MIEEKEVEEVYSTIEEVDDDESYVDGPAAFSTPTIKRSATSGYCT